VNELLDERLTCPCGVRTSITCALCHRALCEHHWVLGFPEQEPVEAKPVCWPKCDHPYWLPLELEAGRRRQLEEERRRRKQP
jgi:hypothetical protein